MSSLLDYKCPACGGALEFDSATQKMKCPFCDSLYDVESLKSKDDVLKEDAQGFSSIPQDEFKWEDINGSEWSDSETSGISVFICNSCGGEIIGDSNTGATECPYCGNNVVMSGRFKGDLKPDYVIPFKLDKNAAIAQYKKHISGKFLLPKQFKDENHINEIKGIYVPFWLYDSKVEAFARFDAENVRHWETSRYSYTEISTYDVFRSGTMSFSHIPVDGSSKMPDDLMESIEPFDFSEAVPFQTAYLAGFFADKYDVDYKQNRDRANERLRQSTIDAFRSTVSGYSSVNTYNRDKFYSKMSEMEEREDYNDPFASTNSASSGVKMLSGSVHYALYPVYLLEYNYILSFSM